MEFFDFCKKFSEGDEDDDQWKSIPALLSLDYLKITSYLSISKKK